MHEVGLTLESDHRFDRSVGIEASAVLTLMRTMFVVIAMLVGVFVGWFLGRIWDTGSYGSLSPWAFV